MGSMCLLPQAFALLLLLLCCDQCVLGTQLQVMVTADTVSAACTHSNIHTAGHSKMAQQEC